jgi:hypothetical protein
VLAVGMLLMLSSVGAGALLVTQNRVVVQVQVGNEVWTGHLYGVLVIGALLACWFLLGAAFIQCRVAERRRQRAPRVGYRARPPRVLKTSS